MRSGLGVEIKMCCCSAIVAQIAKFDNVVATRMERESHHSVCQRNDGRSLNVFVLIYSSMVFWPKCVWATEVYYLRTNCIPVLFVHFSRGTTTIPTHPYSSTAAKTKFKIQNETIFAGILPEKSTVCSQREHCVFGATGELFNQLNGMDECTRPSRLSDAQTFVQVTLSMWLLLCIGWRWLCCNSFQMRCSRKFQEYNCSGNL